VCSATDCGVIASRQAVIVAQRCIRASFNEQLQHICEVAAGCNHQRRLSEDIGAVEESEAARWRECGGGVEEQANDGRVEATTVVDVADVRCQQPTLVARRAPRQVAEAVEAAVT
jgi:hypothetical protein